MLDLLSDSLDVDSCYHESTKSFLNREELMDMPSLIIFSNSIYISRHFARLHILKSLYSNVERRKVDMKEINANGLYYKVYNQHTEIDVEMCCDKAAVLSFIKDIVTKKPLVSKKGARHVILVHSINSLNRNEMECVRTLIEKYYENVYFVFTVSKNGSLLFEQLQNHSCLMNCNIDTHRVASKVALKAGVSDANLVKKILRKSSNDIVNFTLLLHLRDSDLFIGYLQRLIECFFEECMNNISENSIEQIEQRIRNICVKLSTSCVPTSLLCKKVIEYVNVRNTKQIARVIQLSSEIEHIVLISNKDLFAIERYLYDVLFLLK